MRLRLLLVLLLVHAAGPAFAQTGPSFAEAVEMANAGRDADALTAFRQLAAVNPGDHEARLWIARLHERMGNPERAEPVYRSVLLEDPARIDAALGVASTLLARGEAEETIELLEALEERAPRDAALLALLGQAHRLEGRTARAIGYFERAVAVEPTTDQRRRLEDARLAYRHRVETRGFSEQFTGATPDSHSGDLTVNYRLTERLRVIGRGQVQRKFSTTEQRGGAGVEWQWNSRSTLRAHAIVGPGNLVMPEGDYLGELDYSYRRAVWTVGVRSFDFTGARTTFFMPAVDWAATDRLSVGLRYAMAFTETSALSAATIGHSAHLRGTYRLWPRVVALAGYAAGVEDFENFSIDRIGDFRANTVSGGARLDLPTLTSVIGVYERQWRRGNVDMARVTVSIQQRF